MGRREWGDGSWEQAVVRWGEMGWGEMGGGRREEEGAGVVGAGCGRGQGGWGSEQVTTSPPAIRCKLTHAAGYIDQKNQFLFLILQLTR